MNRKKIIALVFSILISLSLLLVFSPKPISASNGNPLFSSGMETPFYLPITASSDPTYNVSVIGNYSAYFKTDSMSTNAVLAQVNGHNFTMNIATSQINGYNSNTSMLNIVPLTSAMNPQHTIINTTNGVITYTNAWINTTLQYQPNIPSLKETLIISWMPKFSAPADYLQYQANCLYDSNLAVYHDGVRLLHPSSIQFNTTGEIDFNDATTNQTYFFLPIPLLFDSAGNGASGNYGVLANNGVLTIYTRIPVTFLSSAVFPVYLDPVFSDGFESGDLTSWTSTSTSNGALAVTSVSPHSGVYCANASLLGGASDVAYAYKTITGQTTLYARAYFNFTEYVPTSSGQLITLLSFFSSATQVSAYIDYSNTAGSMRLTMQYKNATTTTYGYYSYTFSLNIWYNIEVYAKIASSGGGYTIWLNGSPVIDEENMKTDSYGNITTIRCGCISSNLPNAHKVFFDDVLADTSYIASTVSVTFTSTPTGLGFITVNGSAQTTPYTIAAATIGDVYTIAASSRVNITWGNYYIYSSWSDSGAQSHSYTVSVAATVTATFTQKLYLVNGVPANQISSINGVPISQITSVSGVT